VSGVVFGPGLKYKNNDYFSKNIIYGSAKRPDEKNSEEHKQTW